jgi:hypothetical protein
MPRQAGGLMSSPAITIIRDTSVVEAARVVTLTGRVERRLVIKPLLDAIRRTAGVVSVGDKLTYQVDDTILPPPRATLY